MPWKQSAPPIMQQPLPAAPEPDDQILLGNTGEKERGFCVRDTNTRFLFMLS
jgi:hypothetical protein